MRELSLFTGAGGGILGSLLLGWQVIQAVEIDKRNRKILEARQADGILEGFPIWDDVKTFDGSTCEADIVTGGFPCQAFSTAARGRNNAEDLWPEMLRVVSECMPRRVLAENVQRKPLDKATEDLEALGYNCLILRTPASSVGAPHRRVRWWVAADADSSFEHVLPKHAEAQGIRVSPRPLWDEPPTRVANGMAGGMDVYKRAVGNGQVPQVVDAIGRTLGWQCDD